MLLLLVYPAKLFSNKPIKHLHHALACERGDQAQGAQGTCPNADGLILRRYIHVIIVQH